MKWFNKFFEICNNKNCENLYSYDEKDKYDLTKNKLLLLLFIGSCNT